MVIACLSKIKILNMIKYKSELHNYNVIQPRRGAVSITYINKLIRFPSTLLIIKLI